MSSNRRTLQVLLSLVLFVLFFSTLLYQFSVTAKALGYDQPQLQQEPTRQGNITSDPRTTETGPTLPCQSASILVVGSCFLTLSQRKRKKPTHSADVSTETDND